MRKRTGRILLTTLMSLSLSLSLFKMYFIFFGSIGQGRRKGSRQEENLYATASDTTNTIIIIINTCHHFIGLFSAVPSNVENVNV